MFFLNKLKNINTLKKLFKETIWIISGQIIVILCSVFLIKTLTNLLSPEEYGVLALLLTINGLFVQTLFSSISPGASRFFPAAKKLNELSYFFSSLIKMTTLLSKLIVVLFICVLIILYALDVDLLIIIIVAIAFLYSTLNGYNSICNSVQQANRKHDFVAINTSLDNVLKIVFAILFVYSFGGLSYVVLVAFTMSSLVVFLNNIFFVNRIYGLSKNFNKKYGSWLNQIWNYSWPFVLWGLFTAAQLYSDRWALKIFSSDVEVGLYAVIYQFGFTFMALGSGVFINLLTPILFEKIEHQKPGESNVNKISKYIMLIGLVISITAFV